MSTRKIAKKLKAISLFTGAMGLDLGIEKTGFEILACVENDESCVKTIELNRPGLKIYPDDINLVDPNKILSDLNLSPGDIDLVVGGPPCQPFSTAGKRRSFDDFRGNVIIRFVDYVRIMKPKYFILENVRGIYSAKLTNTPPEYQEYKHIENTPGSVVYFLYKEFQKIGYSISFNLFDASLYSVPQKRERFIMFGTLSKIPVPLPKPTSPDKPKTLKDAIGKIQNKKQTFIQLRENHIKYLKILKGGQNWRDLPKGIQAEAMGKSYLLSGGKTGFYRRLSWDKPAPTLVTHPAMPATMLVHPNEMRPLSIEEYTLIQMFPKRWLFSGNLVSIYKQIGNAVPVRLGYVAGMAIINHMEGKINENHHEGSASRYRKTSDHEFIRDFERQHINHKSIQLSTLENTLIAYNGG